MKCLNNLNIFIVKYLYKLLFFLLQNSQTSNFNYPFRFFFLFNLFKKHFFFLVDRTFEYILKCNFTKYKWGFHLIYAVLTKYVLSTRISFFFFFLENVSTYSVHPWWYLFIIKSRHQLVFGVGKKLNPRSLIQSLEILSAELIRIHY